MNFIASIKKIYPDINHDIDYVVQDIGSGPYIAWWKYSKPQPSMDQIQDAWKKVFSEEAEINASNSLLDSLKSAFANFSDGGKAAFGAAFDAVVNHIRRGDIAAAKITVEMAEIPDEVPGVPKEELAKWMEKKSEILALFP